MLFSQRFLLLTLLNFGFAHAEAHRSAIYLNKTTVSLSQTARQNNHHFILSNSLSLFQTGVLEPSLADKIAPSLSTAAEALILAHSASSIAASVLRPTNPITTYPVSSPTVALATVASDLSVTSNTVVDPATIALSRLLHTPKLDFHSNDTRTTAHHSGKTLLTSINTAIATTTATTHDRQPLEHSQQAFNLTSSNQTGTLNNLLQAIGAVALSATGVPSGYKRTTVTLVSGTMTDISTSVDPTTTNALSILLSALPSNVASDIVSEYTSLFDASATTSQDQDRPRPTSSSLSHPTSIPFTSSFTSTPSASASSSPTPTPSTFMTIANHASSTTTSGTPAPATSTMASSDSQQLPNASVAGIATGVAAGVVLFILAGAYLWRRRSQGKAPFGPRSSQRSRGSRGSKRIFPEVAWLYDPRMTPSNSGSPTEDTHPGTRGHSRGQSATSLIPEPREGAVEMAESGSHSPPLHAARPSSPLLAPETIGLARDYSPDGRRSDSRSPAGSGNSGDRRSGSGSPSGRRGRRSTGQSRVDFSRPMTAIWEESRRPSTDGLLQPERANIARHST